jgi:aryl-alcohol dehydrogenase-like predicted oxidoreductase
MSEPPNKLVFGAVSLGMPYGLPRADGTQAALKEADATSLVERALELGITTFDTAPAYGESETRLGRALAGRGRVWTKVAAGDVPADPSELIDRSLDASLARLQRSRVELLQWHNWTAALADDHKWRDAWGKLAGDKRVDQLGATTYGIADAVAAAQTGLFQVVQCEFNLLVQGVVTALANRGVSIAVRSVLLQGALTDEGRALPDKPALRDGVARARAAAAGIGLTRLALRAALEHPAIAHVLVGIDRRSQLFDAVHFARSGWLTEEERAGIQALDLGGDPACDPRTW